MITQFEEKGKIFTQVISKEPHEVIIQTKTNKIEGIAHARPDTRLIDDFNQSELFVAITDATIYDVSGQITHKSDFIIINVSEIVWILPKKDLIE